MCHSLVNSLVGEWRRLLYRKATRTTLGCWRFAMALSQPGWTRWLSGRPLSLTLLIGLLVGCSGSDSPAFSSVSSDGGGSGDIGGGTATLPRLSDVAFSRVSDGAGGVYLGGRF